LQFIVTSRYKVEMGGEELDRMGVAVSWHRANFSLWRKMLTSILSGWSACPDIDLQSGPLPSLGSGKSPKGGWGTLLQGLIARDDLESLSVDSFLATARDKIKELPEHLRNIIPALPQAGTEKHRLWCEGLRLQDCPENAERLAVVKLAKFPTTKRELSDHGDVHEFLDLLKSAVSPKVHARRLQRQ
jgi:hypothetical protein